MTFTDIEATPSTNGNYQITVEAFFSVAPKWNDYVRGLDRSLACAGSETGRMACIHGGERRKVVTKEPGCNGLSMTDALGVFDWHCYVDAGQATFNSNLRYGRGLKNLVNANGWLQNSVTLVTPSLSITSTPGVWWANAVTALPDNSTSAPPLDQVVKELNSAGTIYVLSNTRNTFGYNINADKIAVVTLNGARLEWSGSSTNNLNASTGEVDINNLRAVIAAGGQNYLWIEGALMGYGVTSPYATTTHGIFLHTVKYSKIFHTQAAGHANSGIRLVSSSSNRLQTVTVADNPAAFEGGISLSGSSFNVLNHLRAFNNGNTGILLSDGSDNNALVDIVSANNANSSNGLRITSSKMNRVLMITSANNAYDGIWVNGADATVINNAALINNAPLTGDYGIFITGNHTTLSQAAIGAATGNTINVSSNNNKFTGNIFLDDSNCSSLGVLPGIGIGCTSQDASNFTLSTTLAPAGQFIEKVTTNDLTNQSNSGGSQAYSSIFDWFGFENPFRTWGLDGDVFPLSTNIGRCTTGTCRIWDWSLSSSASQLLNKTGNMATSNELFTPNASCPNQVHGDTGVLTSIAGCSNTIYITEPTCTAGSAIWYPSQTYLKNAVEILDDFAGNNDGLCESNEMCLYTPNFGAYQGHGSVASCNFQGGTVSNVKIFGFTSNGR